MVNLILMVVAAVSLVVWLVQEVKGRRQMQQALQWCAEKRTASDAQSLRQQVLPNWLEWTYRLVVFAWFVWIASVVLLKDGDFALALVVLTIVAGIIAGLDRFVFEKARQAFVASGNVAAYITYFVKQDQDALKSEFGGMLPIAENARSFFPVLLVVLVLRSFVIEPFQIPSASMVPSLEVGDYILVNKYNYGLRLPVIGTKILEVGEPKRGDVMVFFPPNDPRYFIKRVVGLPGDEIRYVNKQLYINGDVIQQTLMAEVPPLKPVTQVLSEQLGNVDHLVNHDKRIYRGDFVTTVKPGHYFMMGDNRDNSSDSRVWGQVPEENIVGQAFAIWMHWHSFSDLPSFNRVGRIR
ncbi:Signal peptidase I [Zhongshania aliphaticivorans]|uniref:Signal peptidase I n=1 Tax=Zhongshania aliphaticivorans TaxID=1470434 RepID=A0A5S9NBW6_9GAMM|nr:signal peptidase I [Zhongshania aliphaticivorans]CAA0087344.1 Signal peptidase I [Zhongshania aliphaticivorans]CAA0114594.1 Signal peptidase I [Zhongshania aliphaticivorans]